jgi:hypothetical protein
VENGTKRSQEEQKFWKRSFHRTNNCLSIEDRSLGAL